MAAQDPKRTEKLIKYTAVQVAIAYALRTLPPATIARLGGSDVRRTHAILAAGIATLLLRNAEYTPAYRKLLGDHIAPHNASLESLDEDLCSKIHPNQSSCSKALLADIPAISLRIARFYAQLYLIQTIIGVAARGRGKIDWNAIHRLPRNLAGSIAFFASFAVLQRAVTCLVAPRPVRDHALAYGALTAMAARAANSFEVEHRLITINKLMTGYIVQEFLPFPPIVYLIGIYLAWSLDAAPAADLIAAGIAANFQ